MKEVVQRICREKYGFTPVKGDIKIGPMKRSDGGVGFREVRVGDKVLNISFAVEGTLLSE